MNCLITIYDMHLTDGETERSETVTNAVIEGSAERYTIEYREQTEEMKDCLTRITVTGGKCVENVREGSYSTSMKIEEGRHNLCSYSTPVGNILMGIYATKVVSDFHGGRLNKLELMYKIDVENQMISRNRIKILTDYKN